MRASRRAITGAILCGGQSSRMGQPKAGVKLPGGRTMIGRVYEIMSALCQNVVLLGHVEGVPAKIKKRSLLLVDNIAGAGPIGGVEALLNSGLDDDYVIVPCDMPLLEPELMEMLLSPEQAPPVVLTHLSADNNREFIEPLLARYSPEQLPVVHKQIEAGCFSMHEFVRKAGARHILVPDKWRHMLINANTPGDIPS